MKGLLENHLNVAALDNDETNKRLTFLFRFEEEFRIPLVKRQQFNSSEAEGLLVIRSERCRRSANGPSLGFPRALPALRRPEGAACRWPERTLSVGLGNSTGLLSAGYSVWKRLRAAFLGCAEPLKPCNPWLECGMPTTLPPT